MMNHLITILIFVVSGNIGAQNKIITGKPFDLRYPCTKPYVIQNIFVECLSYAISNDQLIINNSTTSDKTTFNLDTTISIHLINSNIPINLNIYKSQHDSTTKYKATSLSTIYDSTDNSLIILKPSRLYKEQDYLHPEYVTRFICQDSSSAQIKINIYQSQLCDIIEQIELHTGKKHTLDFSVLNDDFDIRHWKGYFKSKKCKDPLEGLWKLNQDGTDFGIAAIDLRGDTLKFYINPSYNVHLYDIIKVRNTYNVLANNENTSGRTITRSFKLMQQDSFEIETKTEWNIEEFKQLNSIQNTIRKNLI